MTGYDFIVGFTFFVLGVLLILGATGQLKISSAKGKDHPPEEGWVRIPVLPIVIPIFLLIGYSFYKVFFV